MWIHNLNPTLLSFGPLEIRWYGIVYVLGFFLSVWWLQYLSKKGKFELNNEQIWDLLTYLMVGMLIGARLFETFWEPSYYLSNPLNYFKIWQGGMSYHGGTIGIIVAGLIFAKKRNVNFWRFADALCAPIMLASALGRIANFFNGELVGRIWNGSWCVVFPQYGDACRHPSTIYAFAKRMIVFGWLAYLSLRLSFKEGFIFWNFIFWECVGRIIVDFYRQDVMHYGFTVGQWLSLFMIIVSVIVFVKYYKEEWIKVFRG